VNDADFARKQDRFNKVWREVRIAIQNSHPRAGMATMVTYAMGSEPLRRAREEAGYQYAWEFVLRHSMGGKSGPRRMREGGGAGGRQLYFDLDETFLINTKDEDGQPGETIIVGRGDLTKADMEQRLTQIIGNEKAVVHARELWRWEMDQIIPILDRHPGWVYRQAFDLLCTMNGGKPPDLPV
jgi:hypothetical protein